MTCPAHIALQAHVDQLAAAWQHQTVDLADNGLIDERHEVPA